MKTPRKSLWGGWETTKWQSLSEVEHFVDIRSADQEYVDRVLPLEKAAEAHASMAENEGFGKLVLTI